MSAIENDFYYYAKKRGCIHWKWTSPGRDGVPDRILIIPSARRLCMRPAIRFIEWKQPGELLRPGQVRRIKELREAGCIVLIWSDLELAKAYLNRMIECQEDEMNTKDLVELLHTKSPGVVGIIVATQRHADTLRSELLREVSLDAVVYGSKALEIAGTMIHFITRPEHMMGLRFNLILIYTFPEWYTGDSELLSRLDPQDTWDKNIEMLNVNRS